MRTSVNCWGFWKIAPSVLYVRLRALVMVDLSVKPRDKSTGPIGIIAGGGPLPGIVADAVIKSGRAVFICALKGVGDRALENYPHEWISFGSVGKVLKKFKMADCRNIVMIGHVKRPDRSMLIPDLGALANAGALAKIARGGDNQLLSGIAEFLETKGFTVLGAHEVIPENLIGEGALGKHSRKSDEDADIALGFKILNVMGELDIGQAAVICGGHVVAVEAAEGTDEMLKRVAKLRKQGSVTTGGGVLLKRPKTHQDMRIDMPLIGSVTVDLAAEAGLSGIVVQANSVLCHDRQALIQRADELGIYIEGRLVEANEKADS